MSKFWCGVVSREHIKRGEAGGFCQVCHGKKGPLARMSVGDGIVFYSPVLEFKGTEKCQKFTAIGHVTGEDTYQFQMAPDFIPYRRDIAYLPCREISIHPLLDRLDLTAGKQNWGYKFRFGHFELSARDFEMIGRLMVEERVFDESFDLSAAAHGALQGDLLDALADGAHDNTGSAR